LLALTHHSSSPSSSFSSSLPTQLNLIATANSTQPYCHCQLNSTLLPLPTQINLIAIANSTQRNSSQLISTHLNSTQFNATQRKSTQLISTHLNSSQLISTQLISTQRNSSQLNSTQTIWDFDDDNMLLSRHHMYDAIPILATPAAGSAATAGGVSGNASASASGGSKLVGSTSPAAPSTFTILEAIGYDSGKTISFNPYPLMGAPHEPCTPSCYLRICPS
jgi:hypothetical protein